MAIQPPIFSLTPMVPDFDGNGPAGEYFEATMRTFGGLSRSGGPGSSFSSQCNANEVVLGYDAVGLADETIMSIANDIHGRCAIEVYIYGESLDTNKQLILTFHLNNYTGPANAPTAQLFVGANLHHSKEIIPGGETESVLIAIPAEDVDLYFYVRLAGPTQYAQMGFGRVDCSYQ